MDSAAIQLLRERFSQMEDEDLLRIVGEEAADYRPEAIEVARQEIQRRGLTATRPLKTEPRSTKSTSAAAQALPADEEEEEEGEPDAPKQDWVTCAVCGGGLRSAVLLADHPIIAVFEDNREARYVKMRVCPRCGNADMFVDMHTEVTE